MEEKTTDLSELAVAFRELIKNIQIAQDTLENMVDKTNELKTNFEALVSSATESNNEVEKTGSVLKQIKDVSEQTRILGFNASIEAARSGAAGAGFNVIAQEVRRLADNSEKHTESINTALSDLKSSMHTVNSNIDGIFGLIDNNVNIASELSNVMKGIEDEIKKVSEIYYSINSKLDH